MTETKKQLVSWLTDAHAMERATIDNIERVVDQMDKYPQMAQRYTSHLAESRQQLERIEQCLNRVGADPSTIKDTATRIGGLLQSYVTAFSSDDTLKHCLAGYAYENFEIASYKSLIAAADECNETEIKSLCEQSLREEEEMAAWLASHIDGVTRIVLHANAGSA